MSSNISDMDIKLAHSRKAVGARELAHVPGDGGLPFLGHTLRILADPPALNREMVAKYGPIYKTRFLGQYSVGMAGADALEFVLLDRDKNFSSELGWDKYIGRLFSRGLMLLDFDEHRFHRRIMQAAFKRDALEHYMHTMHQVVSAGIASWGEQENFKFYPAIKQLTLDNAAAAFIGLELGPEANKINRAFIDAVNASVAIIRVPIPGLAYWKGLRGRRVLEEYFAAQIPQRREQDGKDMFTRLCHATDDNGKSFSDKDIIDHMIFLMMAAHDTLTSSLSTAAWGLAANPEWQQRLRDEAASTGDDELRYDQLGELTQSDWVFNEALRMWGPVPFVPRRTVREMEYGGVRLPANTQIGVAPHGAHHDETIWTQPEQFDPERFNPERAEHKKHAFGFVPYGGGAHKCIGMHFAQNLAKVFFRELLTHYELEVAPDYKPKMRPLPIPKPRDGLPIKLIKRV